MCCIINNKFALLLLSNDPFHKMRAQRMSSCGRKQKRQSKIITRLSASNIALIGSIHGSGACILSTGSIQSTHKWDKLLGQPDSQSVRIFANLQRILRCFQIYDTSWTREISPYDIRALSFCPKLKCWWSGIVVFSSRMNENEIEWLLNCTYHILRV